MLNVFVVGATQPVEASDTRLMLLIPCNSRFMYSMIHCLIFHQMLTLTLSSSVLQYGIKKIKHLPYHRQHQYFFLGNVF